MPGNSSKSQHSWYSLGNTGLFCIQHSWLQVTQNLKNWNDYKYRAKSFKVLSARNSRWAECSFTLWPFMLWWRRQRHSAAVNATGGPFTVADHSKVTWVLLGIRPIFLAILSTFQEQADRGVALAGKLNYLWSQLHGKCRGWIWFGFF